MSGTGRDGDKRARGNRHTVGKCKRVHCETVHGDWKRAESGSVSRIWGAEEGIQRTDGETIKSLGLPDEAVYLVHLVHSYFSPAFFSNHSIDLFAERFQIFRISKETVKNWRGSL